MDLINNFINKILDFHGYDEELKNTLILYLATLNESEFDTLLKVLNDFDTFYDFFEFLKYFLHTDKGKEIVGIVIIEMVKMFEKKWKKTTKYLKYKRYNDLVEKILKK